MVSDVYNTGKGYAFVTFDRKEDADTAMDAMDGQTILGQQIKVKILFKCVMCRGLFVGNCSVIYWDLSVI